MDYKQTVKSAVLFFAFVSISQSASFCPAGPNGEPTTFVYNFNSGRYDCINQFPANASGCLSNNGSGVYSWAACSGGAGGGGASTLAITTGTLTTYANPAISSPTAVAVFLQSQFNETASGTTGYISINVSSITALGPSPNLSSLSGTLQASQEPAHTGDVTNSAGSLALTAAGTQANITTFTHALTATSSMTITAGPGLTTNFLIAGSSVAISSNTILGAATYYANGVVAGASMNANELSGTLQAAQEPAHTGDITNSAGSLAMTAAATQNNITTLPSALTLGGNGNSVTISSNVVLPGATFYQNGTAVINSTITYTARQSFPSISVSSISYLGGGLYFPNQSIVTASYIAVSTDTFILGDATNGAVQINLAPAASVDGQLVFITKLDPSANKLAIQANAAELMLGTTGLFSLNAQGQTAMLISSGTGWEGRVDPTPAYTGSPTANAGQAVAASSNVYCNWFTAQSPFREVGVRFAVATQNGNMDVALIDANCNRLASAGSTAVPAAGAAATINYTAAYNAPPGYYAHCVQVSNVTATLVGFGIGQVGSFLNTETTLGIPASLTCPGTVTTKGFALTGIVSGGVTQ